MAVSQSLTIAEVAGSQNISTNTSKVRILWTSTQTNQSYNNYTRTAYYYISVDGGEETQYSVSYTLPMQATKTILDVTIPVEHNYTGGGILTVRTWMDTQISAGEIEQTATLELSQIARYAKITSASNFTDESGPSFNYEVPVPLSISTLRACISHDGNNIEATYRDLPIESGSYIFELTDTEFTALREVTTEASSREVRIILRSAMTDGSVLWNQYPVTFTVMERDDTLPEITVCSLSPVNSEIDSRFDETYIQNKSKLLVSVSAEAKYGATITRCVATIRQKKYVLTLDGNTASITTDILSTSGELAVQIDVSDSRTFSTSVQKEITIHAYADPKIESITGQGSVRAYRSDSDGNPKEDSASIWIMAKKSYSPIAVDGVNLNSAALMVRLRYANSENSWGSYISLSDEDGPDSFSSLLDNIADIAQSYIVQLRIEDLIGTPFTIDLPVPTAIADLHLGGNCIGIGQYADRSKPKTVQIAADWSVLRDGQNFQLSMYPIGSIYIATDENIDPATVFGGTWENVASVTVGDEMLYYWKRTE